MIEIPDLNDSNTDVEIEDKGEAILAVHYDGNHMVENGLRSNEFIESYDSTDEHLHLGVSNLAHLTLNEAPVNSGNICDEQKNGYASTAENASKTNLEAQLEHEPSLKSSFPIDAINNNNIPVYKGLEISMNDIQPQTVEISNDNKLTNDEFPLQGVMPENFKNEKDVNLKEEFKLQQAPIIHTRLQPRSSVLEQSPTVINADIPMSYSNSNVLGTPRSLLMNVDHSKPSPQLPPPMASTPDYQHIPPKLELSSLRHQFAANSKTPAEYTLHIIFTQFVRIAEKQLNRFLDFSFEEEPSPFDILAEGVDKNFDRAIVSLGYVARQKPKPVIDSVMYWRKAKSEIASTAAAEVERLMAYDNTKGALNEAGTTRSPSSPIIKPNISKAKRSLSLMRSKSISKIVNHSRNLSSPIDMKRSIINNETNSIYSDKKDKIKESYGNELSRARAAAIQADRKSLASIYILCRVLIEVVKQAPANVIRGDLGDKLEEIIFMQLKTTDPISIKHSLVRFANWSLFVEILGYMSQKRFLNVSDRFIASLEKIPATLNSNDEKRVQMLIYGMSDLRITNYPLEVFEESADFLLSIAKFFSASRNECIIYSYCDVISTLILPLANILTAESNHPTWMEAIKLMYNRGREILNNTNKNPSMKEFSGFPIVTHDILNIVKNLRSPWSYSMYLVTSTLSVSSKDIFSDSWFDVIEKNSHKLKTKVNVEEKCTFIICTARLLWVYLYRLNDTLNNTIKRLDSLSNILFFNLNSMANKKQQWIVPDENLIQSLVELIRIIGYTHLNYVLECVILKLLKSGFNEATNEIVAIERLILATNAYTIIVEDLELSRKPQFPYRDREELEKSKGKKTTFSNIMFLAKNSTNMHFHNEISRIFSSLIQLVDNQFGSHIWRSDSDYKSSSNYKQSTFAAFGFGPDLSDSSPRKRYIQLFASLVRVAPWALVQNPNDPSTASMPFRTCLKILIRNSVHEDASLSAECQAVLKRLAHSINPANLITSYAKLAFQFNDKISSQYDANYFHSPEALKLLRLYASLLNAWLDALNETSHSIGSSQNPLNQDDEEMNKDVLNDMYQLNMIDSMKLSSSENRNSIDDLEWKTIITAIEEIEGNGLFFLCSQDFQTRIYGISILRLVDKFDQAIYTLTNKDKSDKASDSVPKKHARNNSKFAADIGTRLIHILDDTDFVELIKLFKKELSLPERSRVLKLKNKRGLLVKLAASDYGIDSTIWFRLYPKVLDIFFEKSPMAIAMCRSIVCARIVQMYELIYNFSENSRTLSATLFSKSETNIPMEVLVNQWRLYLIFACCSLTSTNEQKITFHSQPMHGRKKSMQMFLQHQKITSAKSVIRMILPFLKSEQHMVSNAVIAGLSSININIFRTFLENVPSSVCDWDLESHKRDPSEDVLRIEIIHILFNITSRFERDGAIYDDEWVVSNLVSIIKNLKSFLSVPGNQVNFEYQRLRRYFSGFLENVFIGLQDRNDQSKWLPFEARIGCFNFLKEWCGLGDCSQLANERYDVMIKKINNTSESATKLAILEVERKALEFASLSTMSALCSGPIQQKIELTEKIAVMSFDLLDLKGWIYDLFNSDNEKVNEIGQIALRNIMKMNIDNAEMYDEVYMQCYKSHANPKLLNGYFKVFVEVIMDSHEILELPHDLICLSLFLLVSECSSVRILASKFLKFLFIKFHPNTTLSVYIGCSTGSTKIYKKVAEEISSYLAVSHPEYSFEWLSYFCMFFSSVELSSRRALSSMMIPWIQNISLSYDQSYEENSNNNVNLILSQSSRMILDNLFDIMIQYGNAMETELRIIWVALCRITNNLEIIIRYLLWMCVEKRNHLLVKYAREIITITATGTASESYVLEKLLDGLSPKAMVPFSASQKLSQTKDSGYVFVANPVDSLPNDKEVTFSIGQISLIFLVDITPANKEIVFSKIPLFFHISLSLLDHYIPIIQDSAIDLLLHLMHMISTPEIDYSDVSESLRTKDHSKYIWTYEDLNNDKKGARTPKNMDLLTRKLLEIFSPFVPKLQEKWSRISLSWATSCAVRHIACRSFQVFRSLLSFLDQEMLKDMLHRLSNTISDESIEIQGFSMQILMTLNAIAAELSATDLIDFPQLFWSGVACLSTINEQEFIEVLSLITKFVSKIDLNAPDTVSCLISTFPPGWEGKFEGLQEVLLAGLRSSNAWDPTIKLLDNLNKLNDSDIIGSGDVRLLMAVLSNLPRYLNSLRNKCITKDVEESAVTISKMAENCNKPSLSRILLSLSKNRFRSKKDFLVQTISTLNSCFFPGLEAHALVFLLGLLSNKLPFVKLETMSILRQLFPLIDLQRDEFVGMGADLISPLLRLLLTDYAEPTLEVLDEVSAIPGSQLDKDILRMSLGTTSMRREYENTATLFGIPEDSGWTVTMPISTAATTRNNVHSVFSTCVKASLLGDSSETDEMVAAGDNIQFHAEEYRMPTTDYTDTISVNVDEPDASLSNVWAALDDFDSFFTKEADTISGHNPPGEDVPNYHMHNLSTDTGYSNSTDLASPIDSVPFVFDKKASVIVNESLARTQSNTSFKNNLSDLIGSPVRGYPLGSAKRSYIPFKNSRFSIKHKQESPQSNAESPSFAKEDSLSPFMSPNLSTSTISPKKDSTHSTHKGIEITQGTYYSEAANQKKKKKSGRFTQVSDTPENNYDWILNKNNGANLVMANITMPNPESSTSLVNPKSKEKKRASHKNYSSFQKLT